MDHTKLAKFGYNRDRGGGNSTAIDERHNAKRLRRDIERQRKSPGSQSLRPGDKLAMNHANIAYAVAGQYRGKGIAYDDLVGEAMLGLLHAAQEYDPARGSFSSYAWWICRRYVHALLRHHRRQSGVSIGTQKSMPRIWTALNSLVEELGRQPTTAELSERTGMSSERLRRILQRERVEVVSLQSVTNEDEELTLEDHVADMRTTNPADRLELRDEIRTIPNLRRQLQEAVLGSRLTDRCKEVFCLRYRLGEAGVIIRTDKDVGRMLNISESRVSQVLFKVWHHLNKSPVGTFVTHQWLRRLPERIMTLADLFGDEAITPIFGPRQGWELAPGKRGSQRRPKTVAPKRSGSTDEYADLRCRLVALATPAAATLLSVVDLLPLLTKKQRQWMNVRFGLDNGSCRRVTTSEVAKILNTTAASVGTKSWKAMKAMHWHGLSPSLDIRKLNFTVDEVCRQLNGKTPDQERGSAMPSQTVPSVPSHEEMVVVQRIIKLLPTATNERNKGIFQTFYGLANGAGPQSAAATSKALGVSVPTVNSSNFETWKKLYAQGVPKKYNGRWLIRTIKGVGTPRPSGQPAEVPMPVTPKAPDPMPAAVVSSPPPTRLDRTGKEGAERLLELLEDLKSFITKVNGLPESERQIAKQIISGALE